MKKSIFYDVSDSEMKCLIKTKYKFDRGTKLPSYFGLIYQGRWYIDALLELE